MLPVHCSGLKSDEIVREIAYASHSKFDRRRVIVP